MAKKYVVALDFEKKTLDWLKQREDSSNQLEGWQSRSRQSANWELSRWPDDAFRFEYNQLAAGENPESNLVQLTERIIAPVSKGITSIEKLVKSNPRAARLLRQGDWARIGKSPFQVKEKSEKRKLKQIHPWRQPVYTEGGDFYHADLTFGNQFFFRNHWDQQTDSFGLEDFLKNDKKVGSRKSDENGLRVEGIQSYRNIAYPVNSWG